MRHIDAEVANVWRNEVPKAGDGSVSGLQRLLGPPGVLSEIGRRSWNRDRPVFHARVRVRCTSTLECS